VAAFAFEKGRVALWKCGLAQRHAKRVWEKHLTVIYENFIQLCKKKIYLKFFKNILT